MLAIFFNNVFFGTYVLTNDPKMFIENLRNPPKIETKTFIKI